ncbi:MAG: DUF1420 family protein [Magnetococcales bacterium]|nr:DUF1420 family protein [Magnetococcales bacterium]
MPIDPGSVTPDAIPFEPLSQFLLPPPFSTLIALLVVVGLWTMGYGLAARLWSPSRQELLGKRVHWAFGFILVVAFLAASVQMLGLAGWGQRGVLAALGGAVALAGFVGLARGIPKGWRSVSAHWQRTTQWEQRVGWGACWLVLFGLLAITLGPPIGSDSMAYHLAEPARWFRDQAITQAPSHALFSRLMGLGEGLIWLGYAVGTDVLSALLQLSGLVVAWIAVDAMVRDERNRLLAALLVFSIPLFISFVPNQKPQMLPMAMIVLAMVSLVPRAFRDDVPGDDAPLDTASWAAIVVAVLCAVGQKYSFAISGGIVTLAALWRAWRVHQLQRLLTIGLLAFTVILLPLFGRNLSFYGDPLAPMLVQWLPDPAPDLTGFVNYLHTTRESYLGDARWLRFFIGHAIPLSFEYFAEILGIGLYAFLLTLAHLKEPRIKWLLIPAACGMLFFVGTGNITARYYTEFTLMAAAAAVSVPWTLAALWFQRLLAVQTLVVAGTLLSGAVLLFPGALTPSWREEVMLKYSFGYAENQALDHALPQQAVILPFMRVNYAYLPRDFVFFDGGFWIPDAEFPQRLRTVVTRYGVTHLMVDETSWKGLDLMHCMAPGTLREISSFRESLNPFHGERTVETKWLVALERHRPGCPLSE